MSQKSLLMVLILGFMLLLASCSSEANDPPVASPVPIEAPVDSVDVVDEVDEEKTFTLEELSAFNGKDGNPAYIAVNGIVYDVSNSPRWRNGAHNGFEAGKDLSEEIAGDSPHGLRVLDNIPIIGRITN